MIERAQLLDRERAALGRDMADLLLPDKRRPLNDALLVGPVDCSASGREHPVDIVGAAPGSFKPGDEAIDRLRLGGFCHALFAEMIEPEECSSHALHSRAG